MLTSGPFGPMPQILEAGHGLGQPPPCFIAVRRAAWVTRLEALPTHCCDAPMRPAELGPEELAREFAHVPRAWALEDRLGLANEAAGVLC